MERINSQRAVIMESRAILEAAAQLPDGVLTLIKNRTAKERLAPDVERHFGKALRRFEKIVGLKAGQPGERVIGAPLRYRHNIVRLRIEPELALEKILQNVGVAQLGDVCDAGDGLGKVRPALKGNA